MGYVQVTERNQNNATKTGEKPILRIQKDQIFKKNNDILNLPVDKSYPVSSSIQTRTRRDPEETVFVLQSEETFSDETKQN